DLPRHRRRPCPPRARRLPRRQTGRCAHRRVHGDGHPLHRPERRPRVQARRSISFQVATDDQAETDRYWNAIVGNGGQESACGWCKDRWGVSWQITPRVLTEAFTGADRAAAARAFEAMMKMHKIDVAAIEAAVRG